MRVLIILAMFFLTGSQAFADISIGMKKAPDGINTSVYVNGIYVGDVTPEGEFRARGVEPVQNCSETRYWKETVAEPMDIPLPSVPERPR